VDELLTTKQLQDLLQVDRVTIYRMLQDGRLRGFKVGGQWRFPRQEIDSWLQEQRQDVERAEPVPEPLDAESPPPSQSLPLSCINAIQGVCAEALGIATVTIDLEGVPLTEVTHSCQFCNGILATEKGRQRCAAAWQGVKEGRFHTCHAGLLCAGAAVKVGGRTVAITAGCQFVARPANGNSRAWQEAIPWLAEEMGLGETALRAAADSVRVLPPEELERIPRLLQRVAETFGEIGEERMKLLGRLHHIAEMSKI
jgi:excisionase family DNA binding protein